MYRLSNGENIFDLGRPLAKVKPLKSNILKTVRDREKVSIEVR